MKKNICFFAALAMILVTLPSTPAFAAVTINGTKYSEVGTITPLYDFSDINVGEYRKLVGSSFAASAGWSDLPAPLVNSEEASIDNLGDDRGNVLKLFDPDGKNENCSALGASTRKQEIVVIDFDVRYNALHSREQIFQFAVINVEGTRVWSSAMNQFSMSGAEDGTGNHHIQFKPADTGVNVRVGPALNADTWYNFKLMSDMADKTFSLIIDGTAVLWNEPWADKAAQYIDTVNIHDRTMPSSDPSITYIDNFSVYVLARQPGVVSVGGTGGSSAVDYADGVVEVAFSEPMNTDTLESVTITAPLGEAVPYQGSYDAGSKVFAMTAEAPLVPGLKYTLAVGSGAKTTAGGALDEELQVDFVTKKQPFGIENVTLSGALTPGASVNAAVNIRNDSATAGTGVLAAALYCDGALRSLYSQAVTAADTNCNLTVTVPVGAFSDCTVAVYLLNNFGERKTIDIFVCD